jgi:large subunit ribosomal protein L10
MTVEKEIIRNEYARRIAGKEGLVVVDYAGLPSEGFNRLRRVTAREGAGCLVVKNLIFRRLLPELGRQGLESYFSGQTSVFYTDRELPGLLKVLFDFEKEEGSPRPKGAYWMGSYFGGSDLERLAALPSKEELLSRVGSVIQGPLRGLVGVLNGVLSGLVGTITALRDQRARS